VLQREQGLLPH